MTDKLRKYVLPNIPYGRLRKAYLEMHRPISKCIFHLVFRLIDIGMP